MWSSCFPEFDICENSLRPWAVESQRPASLPTTTSFPYISPLEAPQNYKAICNQPPSNSPASFSASSSHSLMPQTPPLSLEWLGSPHFPDSFTPWGFCVCRAQPPIPLMNSPSPDETQKEATPCPWDFSAPLVSTDLVCAPRALSLSPEHHHHLDLITRVSFS